MKETPKQAAARLDLLEEFYSVIYKLVDWGEVELARELRRKSDRLLTKVKIIQKKTCILTPINYTTTMNKKPNTASILAALNYLIQKQRLEPKQIQNLLKISIMEAEENAKKVLR